MDLLPIRLTAKRGNWSRFKSRREHKSFQALEQKVFARDANRCRYCGFESDRYQVVVNINNDYASGQSVEHNLATACVFCAQCMFLDAIGIENSWGGYLIYLPELSQADLNNFCRVLFASMLRNDAPYKGKLQTTYLSFQDRTSVINSVFGTNSSDPYSFGQAIIDCGLTEEQLRHPLMMNVRLLPERKFFTQEIFYWKASVFDKIPL